MSDRSDVIYSYDGTFDGLMCCVFQCYTDRHMPCDIVSGVPDQIGFTQVVIIPTDIERAERVSRSIPLKMGAGAPDFIRKAFLSCLPQKEMYILKFMIMGYDQGAGVMYMLSHDVVNTLMKAVNNCSREAHLLQGLVRFSDTNGALSAVIEPKNNVLPIMAAHFIDRYRSENFLIYDKTHRMALIYADHKAELAENIDFDLPEATAEEEYYRSLWKAFYNSVGIKERYNPRCRMNLMPKRFWGHITEMEEELRKPQNSPRPSGLDSWQISTTDNGDNKKTLTVSE